MSTVATLFWSTVTPYTRPRSTTLIPSSGSITSRRASSTSAAVGTALRSLVVSVIVVHPVLLLGGWRLGHCVGERVPQGHPAEQGALDPGRILRHTGEGGRISQHLILARCQRAAPAVHQLSEGLGQLVGPGDVRSAHQVGEHRG